MPKKTPMTKSEISTLYFFMKMYVELWKSNQAFADEIDQAENLYTG